jgi:hypothetical protein
VGLTSPGTALDIQSSSVLGVRHVSTAALGSSSGGGIIMNANAAPSAANQRLGAFFFGVFDGTLNVNTGGVLGFSDENWSGGTVRGTSLRFETVLNGGTTRTERMRIDGAGNLGIGTTGPSNKLSVEGIAAPQTDNSYTLGTASKRWSEVYAATGTINTSDRRHKTDVVDSPLGLEFVLRLKPRAFRWLEGGTRVEWDEEPCEAEEPVFEERVVPVVDILDGVAVERQARRMVAAVDRLPVVDAQGRPVLVDGKPKLHAVPRMTKVTHMRAVKREVPRAGARTHYGLLAQEVKAALDASGVGDFAGWVLADKDDANSQQGLRYDQFIAPLVKAVQELSAQNVALQSRIAALEG